MSDCQKGGRQETVPREATESSAGSHHVCPLPPAPQQDTCTELLPSGNAGGSCCLNFIAVPVLQRHASKKKVRLQLE